MIQLQMLLNTLQAIITAEKCRVNADIEEIVCRFKEEK